MYFDSNIEDFGPALPSLTKEIMSFLNFNFLGEPLNVRLRALSVRSCTPHVLGSF